MCHVLNPFPNKPWFLRVCSTSLSKTLWEKKKLLVTSNFFFSRSVFYPFRKLSAIFVKFKTVVCKFFQFGIVQNLSFGKGLIGIDRDMNCKKDYLAINFFFYRKLCQGIQRFNFRCICKGPLH